MALINPKRSEHLAAGTEPRRPPPVPTRSFFSAGPAQGAIAAQTAARPTRPDGWSAETLQDRKMSALPGHIVSGISVDTDPRAGRDWVYDPDLCQRLRGVAQSLVFRPGGARASTGRARASIGQRKCLPSAPPGPPDSNTQQHRPAFSALRAIPAPRALACDHLGAVKGNGSVQPARGRQFPPPSGLAVLVSGGGQ